LEPSWGLQLEKLEGHESLTDPVGEIKSPFDSLSRLALEKGVIGILLYPADEETAREIFSRLKPDYFGAPRSVYFRALKGFFEQGTWPVDDLILVDEAVRLTGGKLPNPLSELADLREQATRIVTPTIWPEYVNRLLRHVERDALKAALKDTNPEDEAAVAELQERLAQIEALRVETATKLPVKALALPDQPPPPVPHLIEKLLPEGHIAILGGKRGSYKSWLACHLALALATGGKVFDFFPARQAKVLIVDEENGEAEVTRRLWKLAERPWPVGALNLLSLQGFSFADERKRAMLEKYLAEARPQVVIFDVLSSVIGGIDENDAATVRDFATRYILPLTERYRCLFLFVHHLRKSQGFADKDELDQFRGSSEWVNIADTVLAVKAREANKLEVKPLKARRTEIEEPFMVEVEEDEETGKVRFSYAGSAVESMAALEACEAALIEWLNVEHPHEAVSRKEIEEALRPRGYARATVDRAIKRLIKAGAIIKPLRGRYCLQTGDQTSLELEEEGA
jgi:hypothetical protein